MKAAAFTDALLKKDSDISITQLSTHIFEVSSDQPSVFIPELEPDTESDLLNGSLLKTEASTQLARVPVRVVRHIVMGHALVSASVMSISYLVYYILSYDQVSSAAVFTLLASASCTAIFYGLLTLMVTVSPLGGIQSPLAYPIFAGFVLTCVVLAGTLAALSHTLAPLQAGTVCFAQCMTIYGYSLSSPQGIEPLHSALYALLAAMGVWFLGLYGFFVQQAWISAGLLFVFGLLSSAYMGAQIVRADRFSLSDADCKLALFQFYLDPALVIIDRIKKFK